MKYNKYRDKPKMDDTITIRFENFEEAYVPKSKCKFTVCGNYIKRLEVNISDITYTNFCSAIPTRIIQYQDICWVVINGKRYYAKWDDGDIYCWSNKLQKNNRLAELVQISWS
jgi:hypothetical protein